jgi:hypothetical protein
LQPGSATASRPGRRSASGKRFIGTSGREEDVRAGKAHGWRIADPRDGEEMVGRWGVGGRGWEWSMVNGK